MNSVSIEMRRANAFRPIAAPLITARMSDGSALHIKNEAAQPSGSFKLRGPTTFFENNPSVGERVTTASTGNHGIGLSMAARAAGRVAEIMVPRATPMAKIDAIREAGGEVRFVDGGYEDALAEANAEAASGRAHLVPSYDHPDIIAGNRNIFREYVEEFGAPALVYVPIGGGGLLSAALETFRGTDTEVVGVELSPFERVRELIETGAEQIDKPAETPAPSTEGIAIRTLGVIPRKIIGASKKLRLMSVDGAQLKRACRWLYKEHGVRAELGGSAATAAAIADTARHDVRSPALSIVSGGNIDPSVHDEIVAGDP